MASTAARASASVSHEHLRRPLVRPRSVDDARVGDARPERFARVPGLHALALGGLRRHVAHARDARGEKQEAVGRLRVTVHVPQSRDERAARRIDAPRPRRNLDRPVRADRADHVAFDQNAAAGLHRTRLGVEEVGVLDQDRARRHLAQARGLRAAQRSQLVLPARRGVPAPRPPSLPARESPSCRRSRRIHPSPSSQTRSAGSRGRTPRTSRTTCFGRRRSARCVRRGLRRAPRRRAGAAIVCPGDASAAFASIGSSAGVPDWLR